MSEVLEGLKAGIRRFQTEVYAEQAEMYRRAAREPQRPDALVITCADSRIDPETITQASHGELFVTRNIGNMVPAYGEMLGGVSAVVEYAVSALKVQHVVVCGHTDCGAMKALLAPETVERMPAVKAWLKNAYLALSLARTHVEGGQGADGDELLRILTEQNVLLQMQHVRTHPSVTEAAARGQITISGWVYDIGSGEIRIFDERSRTFERVSRKIARANAKPEGTPAT